MWIITWPNRFISIWANWGSSWFSSRKVYSGNKSNDPTAPPVPAAPPPTPRANGGAQVQLGTDQGAGRVTGSINPTAPPSGIASTDNVLAGLGRGGLAL